jgi:hypothetical protein
VSHFSNKVIFSRAKSSSSSFILIRNSIVDEEIVGEDDLE